MDTAAAMQLTFMSLAMVFMATGDQVIRWVHTETAAVNAAPAQAFMVSDQRPHHTQCRRYLRSGGVMAIEDTADVRSNKALFF